MGLKRVKLLACAAAFSSVACVGLFGWGSGLFPRWFDAQRLVDQVKTGFTTAKRGASSGGLEALRDRLNASLRWACKEKNVPSHKRLNGSFVSFSKLNRVIRELEEIFEDASSSVSTDSLNNAKEFVVACVQAAYKERVERGREKAISGYSRRQLTQDLEEALLKKANDSASRYDLESFRDYMIDQVRAACEDGKNRLRSGSSPSYSPSYSSSRPTCASSSVPEWRRTYCSVCCENFYDNNEQPEKYSFEPKFACSSGTFHLFCKKCTDEWISRQGSNATCPLCRAPKIT